MGFDTPLLHDVLFFCFHPPQCLSSIHKVDLLAISGSMALIVLWQHPSHTPSGKKALQCALDALHCMLPCLLWGVRMSVLPTERPLAMVLMAW